MCGAVENDDGLLFREAVALILGRRTAEARKVLNRLERRPGHDRWRRLIVQDARGQVVDGHVATGLRIRERAPVFLEHGFRCFYCGRRLVAAPVIELIGHFCPKPFWFPDHHMSEKPDAPGGPTHPAAVRVYPNVDHIAPLAGEGIVRCPEI